MHVKRKVGHIFTSLKESLVLGRVGMGLVEKGTVEREAAEEVVGMDGGMGRSVAP